ncbi:MAG: phosphoglycerate mutase family protein [bacterium]|nr:phosphoglycerate mutase family protein [bacterium]
MKTIVYLIRHSEPMKKKINLINNDSLQITNEKNPLSIIGEKRAEELSNKEEMKNIDLVIASNYVRAISTAKYIAEKNNKDLYINEMFGERKHGINSWDELPQGFESKQMADPNFKVGNGESQYEVANRMYNTLM